jgi:hypothetical protein
MYLDSQVRVQQELKLEARLALVAHIDHGLQPVLGQRDAVHEAKVERPRRARLVAQPRAAQPKVELDRIGVERVLGRRLAEELPARRAREAVLRERRRRVSGFRGRAEDLLYHNISVLYNTLRLELSK